MGVMPPDGSRSAAAKMPMFREGILMAAGSLRPLLPSPRRSPGRPTQGSGGRPETPGSWSPVAVKMPMFREGILVMRAA
jgi:hypothetical protein